MNHPQQHRYNGPAPAAYPPASPQVPGPPQVPAAPQIPGPPQIPAAPQDPIPHRFPPPAPAYRTAPTPSPEGPGQTALLRVLVVVVSVLKFIPLAVVTLFLVFAQSLAVDVNTGFTEAGQDTGTFADLFTSTLLLAALILVIGLALLVTQLNGAFGGRRRALIVSAGVMTAIDLLFLVGWLLAVEGPVTVGSLVRDFWLIVMVASAQITILVLAITRTTGDHRR